MHKTVLKTIGFYFSFIALFSKKSAAKKAFLLFCTPRKGRVKPNQKVFLDAAKKEIVSTEQIDIQVYEWKGTKETVLLLHGWESNAFRWRNLIEFLKKEDYNIIAFDAPAHGNSSGKILNVVLYANVAQALIQKYSPKHIVGHSVGGMATLYNNHLFNNTNVEKLVILGAPSEFKKILEDYQNIIKFNNRVLSGLKAYIYKVSGFEINYFSISEFVKSNTKKGLLIHDELDKIAPCSDSERVHKNWKNSTFVKTRGLGHSLHQDDVNKKTIDFLKSA